MKKSHYDNSLKYDHFQVQSRLPLEHFIVSGLAVMNKERRDRSSKGRPCTSKHSHTSVNISPSVLSHMSCPEWSRSEAAMGNLIHQQNYFIYPYPPPPPRKSPDELNKSLP